MEEAPRLSIPQQDECSDVEQPTFLLQNEDDDLDGVNQSLVYYAVWDQQAWQPLSMAFAFREWPNPPTKLWQASGPVSKVQSFSAMADFWSFGPPLATASA